MVYGDTNSTLAVALVAAKLHIPIAHVEAGLRSYNKTMPEEINRILCDHVATWLFTPTLTANNNLQKEGFSLHSKPPFSKDNPFVVHCGDIMLDNLMYFKNKAKMPPILSELSGNFALITIHREQNTDNVKKLTEILTIMEHLVYQFSLDVVFPVHPRTRKVLNALDSANKQKIESLNHRIHLINSVSYLEMIGLLNQTVVVLTDSGGLQKEAFFMNKPCIILRTETEWKEIVDCGSAIVTDVNTNKVLEAMNQFMNPSIKLSFPSLFGNGNAAYTICSELAKN